MSTPGWQSESLDFLDETVVVTEYMDDEMRSIASVALDPAQVQSEEALVPLDPALVYGGGAILAQTAPHRHVARYSGGAILAEEVRDPAPSFTRPAPSLTPSSATHQAGKPKACLGARRRTPRGKRVRRGGSKRTTAPARAGPDDGDPEPAGPGDPAGDTSLVLVAPLLPEGLVA